MSPKRPSNSTTTRSRPNVVRRLKLSILNHDALALSVHRTSTACEDLRFFDRIFPPRPTTWDHPRLAGRAWPVIKSDPTQFCRCSSPATAFPMPRSPCLTSPAWTISSSSSTNSSPKTPARESSTSPLQSAFTSPPLSPLSRLRRERVLTTARKRGWLTAPRARHVMEAATTAYTLGTLPEVKYLDIPDLQTDSEENLCDKLNRILDFSDKEEEEEEGEEEDQLKGASQWLKPGKFEKAREESAERLLKYFDRQVLSGLLLSKMVGGAPAVTVKWSKRLYKTAGLTYMKRRAVSGERSAVIELSTKVVDEPIRLYNTLAHEMCHAATWIIDECAKPPHGAVFKSWTRKFSRWDPTLKITTCHDYDIRYKFNYECLSCGQNYGRHSRSINTNKQVCGRCKGTLTLLKS